MAAFAPDIITHIGPLPITNTLIHTVIVDIILVALAVAVGKNARYIPKGIQSFVEPVVEAMYNLTASIASTKRAAQHIFPYVMTFFLFIFVSNFTGLLPGVGTIGFFSDTRSSHASVPGEVHAEEERTDNISNPSSAQHIEKAKNDHESSTDTGDHSTGFVPLLRGATSDINVTLALALISVIATHILSIKLTGFTDYITRWLSFNPINLYVGLLELVAEFTKVISLSFRLFGNIYAGEVALHTISNMFAFIAPLPFLLLESIVSIVQALVFSILTLVFMSVLTTSHHHAEH